MKLSFALAAFLLVGYALADTVKISASKAVLIDAGGPAKGTKGERYLNVEGKATGKYACFAVVQFSGSSITAALRQKGGMHKFKVSGATLLLGQSNANFTKDGSIVIYQAQGNAADFSNLRYPYSPGAGALKGKQVASGKFVKTGKVDDYGLSSSVATAASQGKTITLVIAEGNPNVAATWAALKPTPGHSAPSLLLTYAVGK